MGWYYIYGAPLITFKVILGSFGAFAIFSNWGLMRKDRKKNILRGYKSYRVRDGHVVTMYINRKPYMESQITPITFDLE